MEMSFNVSYPPLKPKWLRWKLFQHKLYFVSQDGKPRRKKKCFALFTLSFLVLIIFILSYVTLVSASKFHVALPNETYGRWPSEIAIPSSTFGLPLFNCLSHMTKPHPWSRTLCLAKIFNKTLKLFFRRGFGILIFGSYIQGWLKCFAAFITNPVTEDENWEIYLSSNDSLLPGELGDLGWVPWLIYVYFLIQSRDSNGFHLTRLLWGISSTVHIFSRMFNT